MDCFTRGEMPEDKVIEKLMSQLEKACVPYSGFHVSAIAKARVGNEVFYCSGVNVEYSDHRLSTHGEEGVMSVMLSSLGPSAKIEELWVIGKGKNSTDDAVTSCCGKCRQQISEYCDESTVINYVSPNGNISKVTVGGELPHAFNFKSYIVKDDADNSKSNNDYEAMLIRKGELSDNSIFNWLASFKAVDYVSKITKAVVLKLSNGSYAGGVSVEDAAFVDISATQAAAAVAASEFGKFEVEEFYFLGSGKDKKNVLPSLAELQILRQFNAKADTACNVFEADGSVVSETLTGLCAKIISNSVHNGQELAN